MSKYIFKLHFGNHKTLTFARELTHDEYEVADGILRAEWAAGILNGFEIKEVTSFESTY